MGSGDRDAAEAVIVWAQDRAVVRVSVSSFVIEPWFCRSSNTLSPLAFYVLCVFFEFCLLLGI
jgi:hypothetical protein